MSISHSSNTVMVPSGLVQAQAVNKKALAQQMGISESSLKRLLKKHQLVVPRGLIPPTEQRKILEVLGWLEKA